jgi:hypothetical protein
MHPVEQHDGARGAVAVVAAKFDALRPPRRRRIGAAVRGGARWLLLWSVALRDWRELCTPGALWVSGLVLGVAALVGMSALGISSTDRAV